MTEADWLACKDPEVMLKYLQHCTSDRKLRLYVCSCCRTAWLRLRYPPLRRAVEIAEAYVDGVASCEQLDQIAKAVGKIWYALEDDGFDTFWTVFSATDLGTLTRPVVVQRWLVNTAISARG